MSERVEIRVIAIGAESAEHDCFQVDVSVGGLDGQITLGPDRVNGGFAAVGDSLDCWVSTDLCKLLLAFDEHTRAGLCAALVAVGSRAIALEGEPPCT